MVRSVQKMYRTRIFFLHQKSQIEYRLQITEQKKKAVANNFHVLTFVGMVKFDYQV